MDFYCEHGLNLSQRKKSMNDSYMNDPDYTTQAQWDILEAKRTGKPIWIYQVDRGWEILDPEHPTQFDFFNMHYTNKNPIDPPEK